MWPPFLQLGSENTETLSCSPFIRPTHYWVRDQDQAGLEGLVLNNSIVAANDQSLLLLMVTNIFLIICSSNFPYLNFMLNGL